MTTFNGLSLQLPTKTLKLILLRRNMTCPSILNKTHSGRRLLPIVLLYHIYFSRKLGPSFVSSKQEHIHSNKKTSEKYAKFVQS